MDSSNLTRQDKSYRTESFLNYPKVIKTDKGDRRTLMVLGIKGVSNGEGESEIIPYDSLCMCICVRLILPIMERE